MHDTIDDRLADWVESMHPVLAGLQDFLLPEDFPMDFPRARPRPRRATPRPRNTRRMAPTPGIPIPSLGTDHTGDDPTLWDFSVDSLDRLERLVQHGLKAEADFDRPENQAFVDGAIWYLGETITRQGNAQWRYIEGERNEDNEWIGRPFLERTEPPDMNSGHLGGSRTDPDQLRPTQRP